LSCLTFCFVHCVSRCAQLVVLNIGLDSKIIAMPLYTSMVIMSLLTTFATPLLLHVLYLRRPSPAKATGGAGVGGGGDAVDATADGDANTGGAAGPEYIDRCSDGGLTDAGSEDGDDRIADVMEVELGLERMDSSYRHPFSDALNAATLSAFLTPRLPPRTAARRAAGAAASQSSIASEVPATAAIPEDSVV
jgi:hypothetical protein